MSRELDVAVEAATRAGDFLRAHVGAAKKVDAATQHDLKLELDVKSQNLIEEVLLEAFPDHAFYGEEGVGGNPDSPHEWIVDPIDGTVNFFYGIPHYCVSIALRSEGRLKVGVIHDPSVGETWSAEAGGAALLDGEPISVSDRTDLKESVVTIGFSKTAEAGDIGMARFQRVSGQVRKCRMMGSAALGLAYIASGRLDAYVEESISLWDIAAGQLLVECAGGQVELRPLGSDKFGITASNRHVHDSITSLCQPAS